MNQHVENTVPEEKSSLTYQEGIGSFRPSLMAQMVKNLPVVLETWAGPLGWEDPLEKGTGTPLQCSCLENPMDRGVWRATGHRVIETWTGLSMHTHTYTHLDFNYIN